MITRFMLRDARRPSPEFHQVTRALYHKAAGTHDRGGQPLRTAVTYQGANPVKWLTLLDN